jgi:hypothetical protein
VNPQEIMAWCLAGLLICNVLTLVVMALIALRVAGLIEELKQRAVPVAGSAERSLASVRTLAESTEHLMRHSVAPLLTNVQDASTALSESAASVRRTVSRMQDAAAKPISMLTAAGKLLDTPAGKAGLLAVTMGIARYAATRHAPIGPLDSAGPKGKSNGAFANL